jgi:hypothetical protein
MKTKSKPGLLRFTLELLAYGNSYYIERIPELEKVLARKPRRLQLDLIGDGEIPADLALLIRSILIQRAPGTRLVTNARSSLRGGALLVWLLGDSRIIREDARVFFRPADVSDDADDREVWKDEPPKYSDSYSETDPDEADYARVLEVINEFLPVKELVGRPIPVSVLRELGLAENEKLDHFLAAALGQTRATPEIEPKNPAKKKFACDQKAG